MALAARWARRRSAAVRRRRLLHRRSAGALRSGRPAAGRDGRDPSASPQYRSHSRPVAHHDAHGQGRASLPAYRRALHRSPPRRCSSRRPCRRRLGGGEHRARPLRDAGANERDSAAGNDLRADPLERRELQPRPHRRARPPPRRRRVRAARQQGDAGADRARQLPLSRVHPITVGAVAGLRLLGARASRPRVALSRGHERGAGVHVARLAAEVRGWRRGRRTPRIVGRSGRSLSRGLAAARPPRRRRRAHHR